MLYLTGMYIFTIIVLIFCGIIFNHVGVTIFCVIVFGLITFEYVYALLEKMRK